MHADVQSSGHLVESHRRIQATVQSLQDAHSKAVQDRATLRAGLSKIVMFTHQVLAMCQEPIIERARSATPAATGATAATAAPPGAIRDGRRSTGPSPGPSATAFVRARSASAGLADAHDEDKISLFASSKQLSATFMPPRAPRALQSAAAGARPASTDLSVFDPPPPSPAIHANATETAATKQTRRAGMRRRSAAKASAVARTPLASISTNAK